MEKTENDCHLEIPQPGVFKPTSAGVFPAESSRLVKSLMQTRRSAYLDDEAGRALPEAFRTRVIAPRAVDTADTR